MSYEIAILNPRSKGKKRRSKKRRTVRSKTTVKRNSKGRFVKRSAARRVKRRKARRSNPRKVARAKRRPAVGYTVGSKKIRRRKLNPRRHRRSARRRHSNPRFSVAGITNQLMPAAYGAAGGIALDLVMGYLPLPAMLQTPYAKHATRIAGALGLGFVARKFLRGKGSAVAAGALTIAVYKLLKDVTVKFAPQLPLGDYEEIAIDNTADQIGAYINGYLPDGSSAPGVGAYISGGIDDTYDRDGAALTGMDY